MAGKSGRSINNVPENPMKHIIFSWEGILVILFILVNIFCASFSEFYNLKSVLRQMPVYLATPSPAASFWSKRLTAPPSFPEPHA